MLLAKITRSKHFFFITLAVICVAAGCAVYLAQPAPTAVTTSAVATAIPSAPLTAPSPAADLPPADTNAQTILELFSPSDPYLTRQLGETAIAQEIEQVMTTSFVLTKCGIISDRDYRDNFRALIVYAQHMKLATDVESAEAKVRQIAESASTSYALVYSRTKCDNPKLPAIAAQLLAWQQAYLTD